MTAIVTPASTSVGPSWEDQIVPTLRKRLEHESAYLSNRLSANNFQDAYHDAPSPSRSPSLSSVTTSVPFPHGPPNSVPVSRIPTSPRSRTKSTFAPTRQTSTLDTSATAGPSSQPMQIPGLTSQPVSADISGLPPSRIPSRPRSKSQLAQRPSGPDRTNSNPPPPLPSAISRTSSSGHGSLLTKSIPTSTRGRSGSPELKSARITEGLVKNELPPFVLYPEDALRIAERGHDLDSGDENGDAYGGSGRNERNALSRSVGGLDDRDGKRQRTVTMGPESRASFEDPAGQPGDASGSRIGSVGLGVPGSLLRKSATNRSASNRNPQVAHPTAQAPRSASMNLIASSSTGTPSSAIPSRLGVAAHFVPPENTYTPPKGANWDEVVLPTVAKKLGIIEPGRPGGEEGDLAVEWDKDGTPIKWVKRNALSASHSSQFPLSDVDDNATPSPSAFSPTFEPSPNNPLRHQPSLHAPSMRQKKSGDSFELRPVRIERGPYADLEREPPVSPAPFSNLAPPSPGHMPTVHRYDTDTPIPSLSRKPSLLQRVTGQASQRSLRSAASGQGGPDVFGGYGSNHKYGQAPGPGTGGHGRGATGQNDSWRPEPAWNHGGLGPQGMPAPRGPAGGTRPSAAQNGGQGQRPPADKHDGSVGKGCGCVIM